MEPLKWAGVAISTTGDEHRLRFLETSVQSWRRLLPEHAPVFVTVDGPPGAGAAVRDAVGAGVHVVHCDGPAPGRETREGHQGVAVNKNTGLELLIDAEIQHLFLCDDDTRPLSEAALVDHIEMGFGHSMVCWGAHRNPRKMRSYVKWRWPRGVMLYTHRSVVDRVGGMIEEFGPGGHEHVEWSRRIHQAGFTPAPYISPLAPAHVGWHSEDMPLPGETLADVSRRRETITSVRRVDGDWAKIEKVMAERDGDTTFVPFTSHANGRA